jgi:hypothetical protein
MLHLALGKFRLMLSTLLVPLAFQGLELNFKLFPADIPRSIVFAAGPFLLLGMLAIPPKKLRSGEANGSACINGKSGRVRLEPHAIRLSP